MDWIFLIGESVQLKLEQGKGPFLLPAEEVSVYLMMLKLPGGKADKKERERKDELDTLASRSNWEVEVWRHPGHQIKKCLVQEGST